MIDLDEISNAEPNWEFSGDKVTRGSVKVPFGWLYSDDENSNDFDWIGNSIAVGSKVFSMPDMSWCLEPGMFYELDEQPWKDVSDWLAANGRHGAGLPEFINRISPPISSKSAKTFRKGCEALSKANRKEFAKGGKTGLKQGSFLGEAHYVQGFTKYSELVLQGKNKLYEPGWLRSSDAGLDYENGDGSLLVTMQRPNNPVAFDPVEEARIGYFQGLYGQ